MLTVLTWLAITLTSTVAFAAMVYFLSPRDKATGYLIRPRR